MMENETILSQFPYCNNPNNKVTNYIDSFSILIHVLRVHCQCQIENVKYLYFAYFFLRHAACKQRRDAKGIFCRWRELKAFMNNHRIPFEEVEGANPDQKEMRNQLFDIASLYFAISVINSEARGLERLPSSFREA